MKFITVKFEDSVIQQDVYNGIVRRVAGYLKRAKDNKNPAAFLTGAGASISAKIPSAPKLIEQVINDFPHCIEHLSEIDKKDYGKCMSALSPDERRILIKPHLDNAKINWGHIALAQIIKDGYVSRVLTFNFDLVLESALSLIGQQCPVYDFGAYPKADLALLAEPSIIHLHGQSYGFVHLNTDEETERHKDAISPILTNTINTRPTVIIGYSGDCDPSGETLQKKYLNQHRLAWLEYSETPTDCQHNLSQMHDYAEFSGGLDFDLFMIALATKLQVWPPKILTNSSGHLLDELSVVTDYPITEGKGLDIFSRVKEHLRQEKDDLAMKAAFQGTDLPKDASGVEKDLYASLKLSKMRDEVHNLWMKVRLLKLESGIPILEEALEKINAAIEMEPNDYLSYLQLGSIQVGLARRKSGDDQIALLEQGIQMIEKSFVLASGEDKKNLSVVLNIWGVSLGELAINKSLDDSKSLFELSLDKFEQSILLNPKNAHAIGNLGITLARFAVFKDNNETVDMLIESIAKVETAIEIYPDKYQLLWSRAIVFAVSDDVDEVILSLEAAVKLGMPQIKDRIFNSQDFDDLLETKRFTKFLDGLEG